MIKKAFCLGPALSALGLVLASPASAAAQANTLPPASNALTVIVLCGFVCICLGTLLMLFRREAAVAIK